MSERDLDASVNNETLELHVYFVCFISVSFYKVLHLHSKANLTFSDVSVWMRNLEMLENASVDG